MRSIEGIQLHFDLGNPYDPFFVHVKEDGSFPHIRSPEAFNYEIQEQVDTLHNKTHRRGLTDEQINEIDYHALYLREKYNIFYELPKREIWQIQKGAMQGYFSSIDFGNLVKCRVYQNGHLVAEDIPEVNEFLSQISQETSEAYAQAFAALEQGRISEAEVAQLSYLNERRSEIRLGF